MQSGTGTFTFQRGSVPTTAMASDVILGTWSYASGGSPGDSMALNAQGDGSFSIGEYMPGYPMTWDGIGTWASSGSGSYAITIYGMGMTNFGQTIVASVSGSTFTIPGGQTGGPPQTYTFSKTTNATSTVNPLSGIWQLSTYNGLTPAAAQRDVLFVARNDGSVFGVMVDTRQQSSGGRAATSIM
jgi:hypothetical protein